MQEEPVTVENTKSKPNIWVLGLFFLIVGGMAGYSSNSSQASSKTTDQESLQAYQNWLANKLQHDEQLSATKASYTKLMENVDDQKQVLAELELNIKLAKNELLDAQTETSMLRNGLLDLQKSQKEITKEVQDFSIVLDELRKEIIELEEIRSQLQNPELQNSDNE